jgi:hypothetical protein
LCAIGCSDDPPSFGRVGIDAAVECDPDAGLACEAGEVCLVGRCYAACASDLACAQNEQCESGVCIPRTRPRPDGGSTDSGPTDLCADVTCETPTPVCHPVNGMCVACLDRTQCAAGNCDIARGVCRGGAAAACSPCDTDVQCSDGMTSVGSCTMLDATFERVCVPSCADGATCPTGLSCDPDTEQCLPRVGTCTGFRAAIDGRSCMADADCVPFGADAAPGQCDGVVPPDTPGTCLQPCGLTSDCPSGLECMDGFCGMPPMVP